MSEKECKQIHVVALFLSNSIRSANNIEAANYIQGG